MRGVAIEGRCVAVAPGLLGDQNLCFHELAHIVQQRGGSPCSTNEQPQFSSVEDEANAAANAFIRKEKFSILLKTKSDKLFQNDDKKDANKDTEQFLKKLGQLECQYSTLKSYVELLSVSKQSKYNLKRYNKMLEELKSLPREQTDFDKIKIFEHFLAIDNETILQDVTADANGITFEELEGKCDNAPPIESNIWECSEDGILRQLQSNEAVRKSIQAHAPACEDRTRNALREIKTNCPSFAIRTLEMLDDKSLPLVNIHGEHWRNHVSIIFPSNKVFDPLMIGRQHPETFKDAGEWMMYHLDIEYYFPIGVTYNKEFRNYFYNDINVRAY